MIGVSTHRQRNSPGSQALVAWINISRPLTVTSTIKSSFIRKKKAIKPAKSTLKRAASLESFLATRPTVRQLNLLGLCSASHFITSRFNTPPWHWLYRVYRSSATIQNLLQLVLVPVRLLPMILVKACFSCPPADRVSF